MPTPILMFVHPTTPDPYFLHTICDLKTLQRLVGGLIELVGFPSGCGCYINEEGKLLNLPVNRIATAIVDTLYPGFASYDYIVGPAVFVGPIDSEGYDTSLPPELVELFSKRFNVYPPSPEE